VSKNGCWTPYGLYRKVRQGHNSVSRPFGEFTREFDALRDKLGKETDAKQRLQLLKQMSLLINAAERQVKDHLSQIPKSK
jgi:hypothetical protein